MTGPAASRATTAVLFDLDGTLVDTRSGVRAAIAAAFRDVAGDVPRGASPDLSLPLDEMIETLDPSLPASSRRRVSEAFRRHYDATWWTSASLYAGVESSLAALHSAGVRSFVVTNKRTSAAERLLAFFRLDPYFERVVGQSEVGVPCPKSELITRCIETAALDLGTSVVVGDSDQDALAAAATGLTFVAVTSGAGPLGHSPHGDERVEVVSLAEAAEFLLSRRGGEARES